MTATVAACLQAFVRRRAEEHVTQGTRTSAPRTISQFSRICFVNLGDTEYEQPEMRTEGTSGQNTRNTQRTRGRACNRLAHCALQRGRYFGTKACVSCKARPDRHFAIGPPEVCVRRSFRKCPQDAMQHLSLILYYR